MDIIITLTDAQAQNALAVYQAQVDAVGMNPDLDFEKWVQAQYQEVCDNKSGIFAREAAAIVVADVDIAAAIATKTAAWSAPIKVLPTPPVIGPAEQVS